MQIRREENITYTIVGETLFREMIPYIQKQGFEYEVLYEPDPEIPDGIDAWLILDGHELRCFGTVCIKSHMNSDDLKMLMHQVWSPRRYGDPES